MDLPDSEGGQDVLTLNISPTHSPGPRPPPSSSPNSPPSSPPHSPIRTPSHLDVILNLASPSVSRSRSQARNRGRSSSRSRSRDASSSRPSSPPLIPAQGSTDDSSRQRNKERDVWQKGLLASITESQSLLSQIVEAIYDSEYFHSAPDESSRFWRMYQRLARQTDEEFLERQNGDLDVQLIFAGLFSAVSSAFIVNMQSDLSPDLSTALLADLVRVVSNNTITNKFPDTTWSGPSPAVIWMQALGYLSLAFSLLAAFGAVLGKQWLGQYKTSRFGYGTLEERAIRRHEMLIGMEEWHFQRILDILPLMLQTSLLLFGVSLAINIFTVNRMLGSLIIATIIVGFMLYAWTFIIGLLRPTSPFQTGLTLTICPVFNYFSTDWTFSAVRSLQTLQETVSSLPARSFHLLRRISHRPVSDVELGEKQQSAPQTQFYSNLWPTTVPTFTPFQRIHAEVVKWTLETSTDPEMIAEASRMVTETAPLWPRDINLDVIIRQLQYAFSNCISNQVRIKYVVGNTGPPHFYYEALLSLYNILCFSNPHPNDQMNTLGQWLDDNSSKVAATHKGANSQKAWIFSGRPRLIEENYPKPTESLRPWNTLSQLCEGINVTIFCKQARSKPLPIEFFVDVWCTILSEDSVAVVPEILLGIARCLGFSGMDLVVAIDEGAYYSALFDEVVQRIIIGVNGNGSSRLDILKDQVLLFLRPFSELLHHIPTDVYDEFIHHHSGLVYNIGHIWYDLLCEGKDNDTVVAAIHIFYWFSPLMDRHDNYSGFWSFMDNQAYHIHPDETDICRFVREVAPPSHPLTAQGQILLWELSYVLRTLQWSQDAPEVDITFLTIFIESVESIEENPRQFPDVCVPLQALWNYRSRLQYLSDSDIKEKLLYSLLRTTHMITIAGNADSYWDTNAENLLRRFNSISQCLDLIRIVSQRSGGVLRPKKSPRYTLDELSDNICRLWERTSQLRALALDFFDTVRCLNTTFNYNEEESHSMDEIHSESVLQRSWTLIEEVLRDALQTESGRSSYLHRAFQYIRDDFPAYIGLLIDITVAQISEANMELVNKQLSWTINAIENQLSSVQRALPGGHTGPHKQKYEKIEIAIAHLQKIKPVLTLTENSVPIREIHGEDLGPAIAEVHTETTTEIPLLKINDEIALDT